MRIVTWNCCRGNLVKKLTRLNSLNPTFAVVQECTQPKPEDPSLLWHGDNPRQGTGVVVSPEYSVVVAAIREAPLYNIPLFVEGPHPFFALAVWSQKRSLYVEGVLRAIEVYRDLITAHPTILLGDFNSNVFWNSKHSAGRDHTALVETCTALGLASAYHQFFREVQGRETRPTSYFQWNPARPYHIDYCFIPDAWIPHLASVEVGTFEDWAGTSDHRPLVVDLAFPETPASAAPKRELPPGAA